MGIAAFHKVSVVRPLNENQPVCSTCQTQLKCFQRKRICFKCKSLNCASCMLCLPNKRFYCPNCYDNEQIQNRSLTDNVRIEEDISIESLEVLSENLEESETIIEQKMKENIKKSIFCRRNQSLSENKTSETSQMAINHKAINHLLTVSDIECSTEISELTVRQLKLILTRNYVDYRGCCEKKDLQEKVQLLWQQKQLYEDSDGLDDSLCKICMAEPIDCVLLECGHMATCTGCGKKLNECPLCRQYIVRIVHTFRA